MADMGMVLRGVGGLVAVLALVLIIAKYARRHGGHRSDAALEIVQRVGLSREASLAVVEVGGRTLVLGVTPHGVSMLSSLGEGPVDGDALAAALAEAKATALIQAAQSAHGAAAAQSAAAAPAAPAAQAPAAPVVTPPAAPTLTVVPDVLDTDDIDDTSDDDTDDAAGEAFADLLAKAEAAEANAEAEFASPTPEPEPATEPDLRPETEPVAAAVAHAPELIEEIAAKPEPTPETTPEPTPVAPVAELPAPDEELGLANALSALASLALANAAQGEKPETKPEPKPEPVAEIPQPRHGAGWFTETDPAAGPVAQREASYAEELLQRSAFEQNQVAADPRLAAYEAPVDTEDAEESDGHDDGDGFGTDFPEADQDAFAAVLESIHAETSDEDDDEGPEFVPAQHVVLPPSSPEPPRPAPRAAPDRRRPLPAGVDLDAYPDLASALRAAGLTSSGLTPSSSSVPTPRETSGAAFGPAAVAQAISVADATTTSGVQDVADAAAAWIASLPRAEGSLLVRPEVPTLALELSELSELTDLADLDVAEEPEFALLLQEIALESERAEHARLEELARAEVERLLAEEARLRAAEKAQEKAEAARLAEAEAAWKAQFESARKAHEVYTAQEAARQAERQAEFEAALKVAPKPAEPTTGWDLLPSGKPVVPPPAAHVAAAPKAAVKTAAKTATKKAKPATPAAGSVLSPATWRQGFAALRDLRKD